MRSFTLQLVLVAAIASLLLAIGYFPDSKPEDGSTEVNSGRELGFSNISPLSRSFGIPLETKPDTPDLFPPSVTAVRAARDDFVSLHVGLLSTGSRSELHSDRESFWLGDATTEPAPTLLSEKFVKTPFWL